MTESGVLGCWEDWVEGRADGYRYLAWTEHEPNPRVINALGGSYGGHVIVHVMMPPRGMPERRIKGHAWHFVTHAFARAGYLAPHYVTEKLGPWADEEEGRVVTRMICELLDR